MSETVLAVFLGVSSWMVSGVRPPMSRHGPRSVGVLGGYDMHGCHQPYTKIETRLDAVSRRPLAHEDLRSTAYEDLESSFTRLELLAVQHHGPVDR